MSVLIKGMEMPKSCGDCKAFVCYRQWAGDVGDCFCGITKNDARQKEKNSDCPLVPVPKHGRLIDADALCKTLRSFHENEYTPEVFANWIENHIDTIIPAEEGET